MDFIKIFYKTKCPVIFRIDTINLVYKKTPFSLIVLMKSKTHYSKVEDPQTFFSAGPKIKPGACVRQKRTLPGLYLQAYKQEFLGESHTTSFQPLCHRKARDNLCADLPEVWAPQLPHTKLLQGARSLRGSQKMKSKELEL